MFMTVPKKKSSWEHGSEAQEKVNEARWETGVVNSLVQTKTDADGKTVIAISWCLCGQLLVLQLSLFQSSPCWFVVAASTNITKRPSSLPQPVELCNCLLWPHTQRKKISVQSRNMTQISSKRWTGWCEHWSSWHTSVTIWNSTPRKLKFEIRNRVGRNIWIS